MFFINHLPKWISYPILLIMIFACFPPIIAEKMSYAYETKLAKKFHMTKENFNLCHLPPDGKNAWDKLIKRIYPLTEEDKSIPLTINLASYSNLSFTVLGGTIIITTTDLQKSKSPEELAGIIAREITYIKDRDNLKNYFDSKYRQFFVGQLSKTPNLLYWQHTKLQEEGADIYALSRLQQAFVNNKGLVDYFHRVKKDIPYLDIKNYSYDDRANNVLRYPTVNPKPILTKDEWETLVRESRYC